MFHAGRIEREGVAAVVPKPVEVDVHKGLAGVVYVVGKLILRLEIGIRLGGIPDTVIIHVDEAIPGSVRILGVVPLREQVLHRGVELGIVLGTERRLVLHRQLWVAVVPLVHLPGVGLEMAVLHQTRVEPEALHGRVHGGPLGARILILFLIFIVPTVEPHHQTTGRTLLHQLRCLDG